MSRDEFIIYTYCLVCDEYAFAKSMCHLREQGGFLPMLSDEEVITLEICGEFFKYNTDKDIYDYFFAHYRHFFPKLRERSLFVRQAANLWGVKRIIQERLVWRSGQAQDPIQVIDTLPLPVCGYTRGARDRCFKPDADYGYCAAKDEHYYGFKCGLRITRCGMITGYPLLPARPHDVNFREVLSEGFCGIIPADKGFIDAWQQALQSERHQVVFVTPPRRNMAQPKSKLYKVLRPLRKRIETVGSQLTGRFAVNRIRVHDLWHLGNRIIRKILAHTIGVFMNLQLHRSPLDFDGLLSTV